MWTEFAGIIKVVKLKQAEAKSLQAALADCKDHKQADGLLEKINPEEKSPGDCREYRAFYAFCKACIYYESELMLALETAAESALHAIDGFRNCGHNFNEGISCRLLGIIYHKQGKANLAIAEYNRAIQIFKQISELYESENNFEGKKECEQQIRQINSRSVWPNAHIIMPLPGNEPLSQIATEEIVIGGKLHKLYSAHKIDHTTTITPGSNYSWRLVMDKSMLMASPTPIEIGDYILVELGRQANIEDIVAANLGVSSGEDHTEVIKRFAGNELRSESDLAIAPIPITQEVKIIGVGIVIAKPAE